METWKQRRPPRTGLPIVLIGLAIALAVLTTVGVIIWHNRQQATRQGTKRDLEQAQKSHQAATTTNTPKTPTENSLTDKKLPSADSAEATTHQVEPAAESATADEGVVAVDSTSTNTNPVESPANSVALVTELDLNSYEPGAHGWTDLGGQIIGAPAVMQVAGGSLELYAVSESGTLLFKKWDGNSWYPSATEWENQDQSMRFSGQPVVIAPHNNRRDILVQRDLFVRGPNGELLHKTWNGRRGSNWENLSGKILGAPAIAQTPDGNLMIYIVREDHAIYFKQWSEKGWEPSVTGWSLHDNSKQFHNTPAFTILDNNRADMYIRGPNGDLLHQTRNGRSWSRWKSLGGQLAGSPAAALVPGDINNGYVYVVGQDGQLWLNDMKYRRWKVADSTLRPGNSVAVISNGYGQHDVFVRGKRGNVYYKRYRNTATRIDDD